MAAENDFVCRRNFRNIFVNINNICRFCLAETEDNVSIKNTYLSEGTEGDSIFNFMLNLKIVQMNSSEKLPSLMCKNCHEVIKMFYSFTLLWKQSEKQLGKSYIKAMKETKENTLLKDVQNKLSNKNSLAVDLRTNNQLNKKLETIFNIQKIKAKTIPELSKNLQCKDFTDFVSAEGKYVFFPGSLEFNDSENFKFSVSKPEKRSSHSYEYNCRKCLMIFTEQENLITHYKTTHSIDRPSQEDINEANNSFKVKEANFCFYCIPHKEFETGNDLFAHLNSHEKEDCYNFEHEDKILFKSLNEHLMEVNEVGDVSWEDFKFFTEEDLEFDEELIDLC